MQKLGLLAFSYLIVIYSILGYRKKGPDEKLPEFSALSFCLTIKKPTMKSKKVICTVVANRPIWVNNSAHPCS